MDKTIFNIRAQKAIEELGQHPDLDFAREIVGKYPEAGFFLVGGAVRDAILGKKSKDLDLVVNNLEFSRLVPELLKYGRIVFDLYPKKIISELSSQELDELLQAGFGVLKFFLGKSKDCIDIALPRTDNHQKKSTAIDGVKRDVFAQADPKLPIEEDLKRRDFTINAMAVNLGTGELIDTVGGLNDLENKILKTVGEPEQRILKEDLSRAFRGLRLANQLDFEIDSATLAVIKKVFQPAEKSATEIYTDFKPELLKEIIKKEKALKNEISWPVEKNLPLCWQVFYDERAGVIKTAVSPEVASKEILKALDYQPAALLEIWDEVGALKAILPEVSKLKEIPQPEEFHAEGDAFKHTHLALEKIQRKDSIKVKLAVLLHDIGKATTIKTPEKDGVGRIRFDGHAKESAELAGKILKRLKIPNNIIEPVVWAIGLHMVPLTSGGEKLKKSTVIKYFFRDDGWSDILLKLTKYDAAASIGPEGFAKMDYYEALMNQIQIVAEMIKAQAALIKPLVIGDDLIKAGLKAGPNFKQILETGFDYQIEHTEAGKTEVLDYLKKQDFWGKK